MVGTQNVLPEAYGIENLILACGTVWEFVESLIRVWHALQQQVTELSI